MKIRLLFSCLLISLHVFSQDKNDSTAIVKLLVDDYKTMGTWDIKRHTANCTKNYLLIENGEIWNMENESEHYRSNAHRIIDRKDYFDIKYVRVFGNTAYAVYSLKSDIVENGNLRTKNWNESVIFRKLDGNWKIELIHSTPITVKND